MQRSSSVSVVLFQLALSAFVAATAADADTLLVGPEFQVNTFTTSVQGLPDVAAHNAGFVVVWHGYGSSDYRDVHGRRYDAGGAPLGTQFQINTYTTYFQQDVAVSSAADGSFVVVWESRYQDGDGYGIHGQRYDSSGTADGTEFQVNTYTTGYQLNPGVSSAVDGSFVVVWDGQGPGDDSNIFARRFDNAGSPVGTEFMVKNFTTGFPRDAAISSATDGSFVVVWRSNLGISSSYLEVRQFDASGSPLGTADVLSVASRNERPAVDVASDGSFVVVWQAQADGSNYAAVGARYDAMGVAVGTEFLVNSYTTDRQSDVDVAIDDDGSFLAVWLDERGNQEVFARRFDSAGTPDGIDFQVNTYTTNSQRLPAVASDGAGGFVAAWESVNGQDGNSTGVFAQRLCADANANAICDSLDTTTTTVSTTTTTTTTTTLGPPASCAPSPQVSCVDSGQAKLDYNEKSAGKEKMKLQWKKLADPTTQGDFGNPVSSSTSVAICIYNDADALVQEFLVDRGAQVCAGKVCWKAKGTKGYGYKDKDNASDGISKIGYGSGDAGKGKADAGGKNNAAKGQNALPTGVVTQLTGNTAPTIQMVTNAGFCATATMSEVKKDEPFRYSAQLK